MTRLVSLTGFLLLWLTAWASALQITAGPTLEFQGTSAIIRWTTDVECGTVLKYGLDPDHLNHRAEGSVGLQHEVTLPGLTSGQRYHYSAGTAKKSLKTGEFQHGIIAAPTSKPAPLPDKPAPASKPAPPAPAVKPAPRPAPALPPSNAPPARVTWGDYSSLQDHYLRHGKDFQSTSAEHYARQAWEFLQRAMDEGLPAKVDDNGVIRVYEPRTKSFGSYNRNGTTKTYFKPQRPDYFRDQPGRPTKLTRPK